MVYNFSDKTSAGSGMKFMSNQQLADELPNQLLQNLKDAESILLLKIIFGEMILLTYN